MANIPHLKLLQLASPKDTKNTMNLLIDLYNNIDTEVRAIADTANATSETALNVAQATTEVAQQAVTIAETAVGIAETAVGTAETAVGTAENAVEQSNAAVSAAQTALTTSNIAITDSAKAVTDSTRAVQDATAAINTANTASTNAEIAVETSNLAKQFSEAALANINEAVNTARQANENSSAALSTASQASTIATESKSIAEDAKALSQTAKATAQESITIATEAQSNAVVAKNNAIQAVNTANDAKTIVDTATTKADNAVLTSNMALELARNAQDYNKISNRPSIAGIELYGDKPLDTFGIASIKYVDDTLAALNIPDIEGLATEDFVNQKIAEILGAPAEELDTLKELAAAIKESQDALSGIDKILATKADKTALDATNAAVTQLRTDVDNIEIPTSLPASDVYAWAKQPTKPEYNYNELKNTPTLFSGKYEDLTGKPNIPDELADLTADATHRVVTDAQIATWNAKSDFSGSYNALTGKPTIPTKTSQLTNDSNFITINSVPTKTSDLTNDSGFITAAANTLTYYYKKTDTYSKTEVDNLLANIDVDLSEYYKKTETFSQSEINTKLGLKADSTALATTNLNVTNLDTRVQTVESNYYSKAGGLLTGSPIIPYAGQGLLAPRNTTGTTTTGLIRWDESSTGIIFGDGGTTIPYTTLNYRFVGDGDIKHYYSTAKVSATVLDTKNFSSYITLPDTSSLVTLSAEQTISGTKKFTANNNTFTRTLVLGANTPINFTGMGSGTYNIGAFVCNTTDKFGVECPRESDSASAAVVPFRIGARGGQLGILQAGDIYQNGKQVANKEDIPDVSGKLTGTKFATNASFNTYIPYTENSGGNTTPTYVATFIGNNAVNGLTYSSVSNLKTQMGIPNFVTLTQAAYDALSTKDANTYYFIEE